MEPGGERMAQTSRYLKVGELLAILNDLWRGHDTGTLVLQRESITKFLYFQDGQVIFAASNAAEDKFTQILIDQRRLTVEQVNLANQKRESRTLGRTLVDLGFISSEDLLEALIAQVRKIALSVAEWTSGTSSFKPNVLPPGVAKLPITTERLVLDTVLSMGDRTWVGQALGGLESVLKISNSDKGAVREMPLAVEEIKVLEAMDGRRSLREICEATGVDTFLGAKFVLGLFYLHFAHRKEILVPQHHADAKVDLSFLDEVVPPPATAEKVPAPEPPPPVPPPPTPPPPVPTEIPNLLFSEPESSEPKASGLSLTFLPPAEGPEEPPAAESIPLLEADVEANPPLTEPEESPDLLLHPVVDTPACPPDIQVKRKPKYIGILAAGLLLVASLAGIWWFQYRPPGEAPRKPTTQAAARKVPPTTTLPAVKPAESNLVVPPALGGPANEAPSLQPPPSATNKPATGPGPANAPPLPPPTPAAAVSNKVEPPPVMKVQAPSTAVAKNAPAPLTPNPDPKSGKPTTAAKGGDLLRAGKYPEAAQAFRDNLKKTDAAFTIDVEIACQPDTLVKAVAAAQGDPALMVIPFDFRGRSCYRVIWGTYKTRADAEAALKKLPAHFVGDANPPKVRSWAEVKPGK
jgi:hypothetical protein